MKTVGIDIVIGAAIGGAIKSLEVVTGSTKALGSAIKRLNDEKISILENTPKVKKLTDRFNTLEQTLDHLYKKKKDLQLKRSLAKTDEEAKSLNAELKRTNTRISALNAQKLNLKNQLTIVKEEAERTDKAIRRFGGSIRALDDRKLKIQANLEKRSQLRGKLFDTVALGVAVAAPFKAGIDFEKEMARVKALSGATGKAFMALQNSAKKLGSTTVFSASEAAKGMQFLAMAGFKTNQIIKAMPGLLDLAAAGQTDLATTADITSNILSGFGIGADKTSHVADVLAKAMTTANVDVGMLGETMKYVAPAASGLGASLEEVTTLAAKLGDVGIQGSAAGTVLRSMYARMASPPKEAQKAIAALGLQTKDANGKFVGMIHILRQLQEKTKGMGDTKIADYMRHLFGVESMSGAMALLKVPTEKLKAYETSLKHADGTAKKIAKTQTDTVAGSFKALGSAVEGLSISLSSLFLPVVKKVTTGITWLTQKINGFVQEHKTLASMIGGAIAGFGALSVASFALGYAATFVSNAWHKTRMAFTLLKHATLLLTTAESRAAIQTKLLAFYSGALNAKARLVTVAKSAWSAATTVLSRGLGGLGAVLKFVGNGALWLGRALMANPIGIAVAVIAGGAYLIYKNWDRLKGWFGSLWRGIKSIFSTVWSGIKSAMNYSPIGIVFTNWGKIKEFFGSLWRGIKSRFANGASFLKNIFLHPINTIQTYWHKLIGWISKKIEWVTSIGSKIKSFFGFGDDDTKAKKLSIKPVVEKMKPIVAASAMTATVATAQNIQTPAMSKQTTPSPVYNYNITFGDIIVETKDGKIADPNALKHEIERIVKEIEFEKKQRSLSDVV